ncbi:MAG: ROK family protein [Lactobacillaceae bacterium]|jgi:predicted NBD/HSP70 family sugar kinase|nr:ROK family protein [Lactobacillaceae bacterium]
MNTLGIDVGGTTIKYALVDENGIIDESTRGVINTVDEKDKVINSLKTILETFPTVEAVGVSFPGVVQGKGYLRSAGALRSMFDIDLYKTLSEFTDATLTIINDANAATLAEKSSGAAQDFHDYVLFAVGTGIGGGIVINNQIVTGHSGMAGEFGFLSLDMHADEYDDFSLSRQGAIGGVLGGLIRNYRIHSVPEKTLSGIEIFELADHDEPLAKREVANFYQSLAQGIIDVVVVLDPEVVVVSGGITQRPTFLTELKDAIHKLQLSRPRYQDIDLPEVVLAKLKADAGIVGAAYSTK